MKIVIINKSDRTGGAAMVSMRLMQAMRDAGIDARMLVVEKLTDSPYVVKAAGSLKIKWKFLVERLKIFILNGFRRDTLFKIDTGAKGLPLWRHPLVKEADAVLLNWVNQGMLSLSGIERMKRLNKPLIWTMHDMWCMTSLCHHAGGCTGYHSICNYCPLLGRLSPDKIESAMVWADKNRIYDTYPYMKFVAVSNWLYNRSKESSLLRYNKGVYVIPNVFPIDRIKEVNHPPLKGRKIRIGFGAARLDDPIKGFPVLIDMTRVLKEMYSEIADELELVTFGGIKDASLFREIAISHRHLGVVSGEDAIRKVYEEVDIVVSSSSYETLPGTLVEAQAYGCIPVSFNRGGQSDIIDHLQTGYIAPYSSDMRQAAMNLSVGILWACSKVVDEVEMELMRKVMQYEVRRRFSPQVVVDKYIRLIEECKSNI
ncbi:glycosyltransferase [Lepagella muris]|jgi:glycosyltransferase involved in cell wall biosynthesis|uniref:Glycosyltransferase n=1 Tax=Lepagella muris TaxID=3032870 RepID=A0AC61RCY7_9BACT|nr:glycosyltransferase [Lepagella muris]ROT03488.1 glycosyltransferase [Muribaculaceae bacterium Isolate-037 (Harlan)]TGY77344.1 glycosyltransferase [Lepagella muris]THG49558.1 glycosyltransferase [Bacteroidales bacterium]TKC54719.1 glycosyltransferase [Bacteroidales bacterium]